MLIDISTLIRSRSCSLLLRQLRPRQAYRFRRIEPRYGETVNVGELVSDVVAPLLSVATTVTVWVPGAIDPML